MRKATLTLLLALACLWTGKVSAGDADARAAIALALATHTEAVTAKLCPCSLSGTCECTSADSCGCLADGYRWVATSNPNQTALYRGQHQCGNYWHAEKEYKRLIDRPGESLVWTHETCPVVVPVRQSVRQNPSNAIPIRMGTPFLPVRSFGSFSGRTVGNCSGGG